MAAGPLEGSGTPADKAYVKSRARGEDGFGLIELLIAMVVLNVGILAIVAAFNSGIVSLARAAHISTAATLADAQMEWYRGAIYGCIYENLPGGTDTTYTSDAAYDSTFGITSGSSCSTAPSNALLSSTVGPDHHRYRVDTYVVWACSVGSPSGTSSSPSCTSSGSGRPVKKVTVVVRDASTLVVLARESSTFDQSTG
jgi:type II secretory pathway pseudopilin PulG